MTADVVIVAAGASRRMGGDSNKVLHSLGGRSLLAWVLDAFQRSNEIRRIVLVGRPEERETFNRLVQEGGFEKALGHWAEGGSCRAESVHSGLTFLKNIGAPDYVLVHDGARPFVTTGLIQRCLEIAVRSGAAIAATAARDTIKEVDESLIVIRTLDRKRLWLIQTPQVFHFEWLWDAYTQLAPGDWSKWTDDAMVYEASGRPVTIVPGESTNQKITTPEDLLWAEALLQRLHSESQPE